MLSAVKAANLKNLLGTASDLLESLDAREALKDWLFMLTWQLRIWHDLPYCVASAKANPESSNTASAQLLTQTEKFLEKAKSSDLTMTGLTAVDFFELVNTLSWGIDHFGDGEPAGDYRDCWNFSCCELSKTAEYEPEWAAQRRALQRRAPLSGRQSPGQQFLGGTDINLSDKVTEEGIVIEAPVRLDSRGHRFRCIRS